ncbi:MAG: hypothetical protein HKM24_07900, partial [Gammaproteobacteria bacterium]|nr:hypothetical protein [Gammaproteobacteria bacterium]
MATAVKNAIDPSTTGTRSPLPDYELFDENTQAIVFNFQPAAVQRMLDFDITCRRQTPSVAAIVYAARANTEHRCFWGNQEVTIPIYRTIEEAAAAQPQADVMINFASFRSAFESTRDALLQPSIRTVAVIAEGIPERRARELAAIAKEKQKWIVGPATVGGVKAGKFKVGNAAGTLDNITDTKLYIPGCVGFVSKSGGMSNEMYNTISLACGPEDKQNIGYPALNEGIAIGGDSYPGSSLLDHLLRFEANPDIKMLVALGEVGGTCEYEIVKALNDRSITKPLVIWS